MVIGLDIIPPQIYDLTKETKGSAMAAKDIIVTKSNELINASYRLTLNEQRLVLIALGKLDSRNNVAKEFTITAQEFSKLTGTNPKKSYDALYAAGRQLFRREIDLSTPEEDRLINLVEEVCLARKGEGRIKLTWTNSAMIYISELKSRFTSYKLNHALSLSSSYAIRIFEMLMQFKTTKSRTIKLDDFRSMLKLENKYPQFKELNKFIIKPAIKDINENTPYIVSVTYSKTGRSVTDLHFDFTENGNFEAPEKEMKRAKKVVSDAIERCKKTIDMFGE